MLGLELIKTYPILSELSLTESECIVLSVWLTPWLTGGLLITVVLIGEY